MSDTHPRSHGGAIEIIMGAQRGQSEGVTQQNVVPNRERPPSPRGIANPPPRATTHTQEEFDPYGAELGEDARVWKTYVKEADRFDIAQVDRWNRSLDVTLIFATFFAAICTAFVVESSKSLKEDPDEMSARRLDHITGILLVMANVTNPSELNTTRILNPDPFSPRPIDVCINALWTFSLITSVAVPPIAMLAKDWCYPFMIARTGDPWSQTKRRQQSWERVNRWRMEEVILFLPSLIHLAFLSFAVGLCLYVGDLYSSVAIPATVITLGSVLVYVASTLLPLWDRTCPYRSSIVVYLERFWWPNMATGYDPQVDDPYPDGIAMRALAWLIKSSKDQKSIEIALQAIAGADPNDEDRALLRNSKADKMILRRLIGLDSYSRDYNQILDLYTRAQSFFQSSLPTLLAQKGTSAPAETEPFGLDGDIPKKPTREPVNNSNRDLQKKLRNLRDTINQKITTYATSDPVFLPVTHNIEALRIGSTAASYCLQSLQHGAHIQTEEQFESAVVLLESYRKREAYLHTKEIQYLMIGVAMLLSSLLVDCPPALRAQYAVRLLRMVDRAKYGQKQLGSKYLCLPLAVYALSQHDYPGWTQPPPFTPISRAERAIEMISHYVSHPEELDVVTPVMVNLGLLELLSDSEECNLEARDIVTIGEAFIDDVGRNQVYTMSAGPYPSTYSRTLKGIATVVSNMRSGPSKDAVAIACLTALNRIRMDGPITDAPMGQLYVFAIECMLNPPLGPVAYGVKAAHEVLQKLNNYPGWTPELIIDLAESLDKRQIVTKLKEATELDATVNYQDFEMKLFATGQACFLIRYALESTISADLEAWRCLTPFIEDENMWDSPEDIRRGLEKERNTLAESYGTMWRKNDMRRRRYGQIFLSPAGTGEGGLPIVSF